MGLLGFIEKKRDGGILSRKEITDLVHQVTDPKAPEYQIGALLMAVYLRGLSSDETIYLTEAMIESGDKIDLSDVPGIKVDKHSTGGVGDKTSLVLMPLLASMGIPAGKLSGRGLGHTGGTLDKLDVFTGIRTNLSPHAFARQMKAIGIAIGGQTDDLVPADQILYKYRNLTGTVGSIPLIASSIMSKKIAAGADCILLDVKVGSGSTLPGLSEARELAKQMISIGSTFGIPTRAVLSDMSTPLGRAIGNKLEVAEAVKTLRGQGPADLTELCLTLACEMVSMAGDDRQPKEIRSELYRKIDSGKALNKLIQMVDYQAGDTTIINNIDNETFISYSEDVVAGNTGYIEQIDALQIGKSSVHLGAGRQHKDDQIDLDAGIYLHKKPGEKVTKGESLLTLYTSDQSRIEKAKSYAERAISFSDTRPDIRPLILETGETSG